MELGGLITAIGRTDLDTQRLKATPFSRGGVSYLDTEWLTKETRSGVEASVEQLLLAIFVLIRMILID